MVYLYLHLVDFYGICRSICQTWIQWVILNHQPTASFVVQSLHIHVASVRLVALADAFVVARHCARGNAHAMQPESQWGKGPKMGMLMWNGRYIRKKYIYIYVQNMYIYRFPSPPNY